MKYCPVCGGVGLEGPRPNCAYDAQCPQNPRPPMRTSTEREYIDALVKLVVAVKKRGFQFAQTDLGDATRDAINLLVKRRELPPADAQVA